MHYKKIFNSTSVLFKIRVFLDKREGLDFVQTIHPEEVGLDTDVSYHSSPSGNKYLDNVLKDLKITNKDWMLGVARVAQYYQC